MPLHERKCWDCGNVADHEDNVTPAVLCNKCGSQDTRATKVKESRCRSEVIADYIGTTIDDILDECPYWKMAPGDTEPVWFEIRDAIMEKVFAVEHEMGRQELHAEQVVENCL